MKNKIVKSNEVLMEEAIHRAKARYEKRKKLCMIDDSEIPETQQYETSFKGTHPIGEDAYTQRRRAWLKEMQNPDSYARFYKLAFWFTVGYFGLHLFVALLRLIYKI